MEVNACMDKLRLAEPGSWPNRWLSKSHREKCRTFKADKVNEMNPEQKLLLSDGSDGSAWDLRAEIQEFCKEKGKDISELSDADWMTDFDDMIFAHEMYSLVKTFMKKLQFISSQLEGNIRIHMLSPTHNKKGE